MQNGGRQNEVKNAFNKYSQICKEAAEAHNSLSILPIEVKEMHDTWYKAKLSMLITLSLMCIHGWEGQIFQNLWKMVTTMRTLIMK